MLGGTRLQWGPDGVPELVFSVGQVHKSYYLSKMPQSIKERTLRKTLMSWQRSETTGDDNVMTFADAHGEVHQLFLPGVVLPVFCMTNTWFEFVLSV